MKTSKQSFESGDFVEITFTGHITGYDPHSDYPYTVTFTTGDNSKHFTGCTLPMNDSNMKPMNFGAYPWRLRYLVIISVIAGFLACGCVLAAISGYWINFLIDIGILSVFILTISNHLAYFKKHYEEIY